MNWEQVAEVERAVQTRLRQYPRLTRGRLVAMLVDARDFGRLNSPEAQIAWEHFLRGTLPDFDELPVVGDGKVQGTSL